MKFKEWDCLVCPARYKNGRKAIELVDPENGEPIAVATVNLVKVNDLPDDHVIIKGWSENEGMEAALQDSGIIETNIIKEHITGYVTAFEYKLTEKSLKLWK